MAKIRVFLGAKLFVIWTTVIAIFPILAMEEIYEINFDPYFIGRQQSDCVIVVNFYDARYTMQVDVEAYDPFTGDLLDMQIGERVLSGRGIMVGMTRTIPKPHATRLVVHVKISSGPIDSAVGSAAQDTNNIQEPQFSVTRLLISKKSETILQVKGTHKLLDRNSR